MHPTVSLSVGLHHAVQGAVVLLSGAKLVQGGDLLPVLVGGGVDICRGSVVEEAFHVPFSQLFGMFGDVRIHHASLFQSVCPPELELQVADGRGAASQAGQE